MKQNNGTYLSFFINSYGMVTPKAEKQLKAEGPKVEYTLDDVVKAAQYGFTYRGESQNDGKEIPVGNVLQWLMHRKSLINVPKEFQDYKSN